MYRESHTVTLRLPRYENIQLEGSQEYGGSVSLLMSLATSEGGYPGLASVE